ncbi:hypothetical protein [Streptomyces purpurogeneiscleroticus]|uniref:hypothetical protein n=1 Tax=Streptomyces purpurogeneiscleroticus TaxID=68259 RepID=UPI001CBEB346|nr:hypothetical protein [Streptomyces purpurogeneiscleroticus]MBZ4020019.1 hypothetical protein [Streptomyces purpurogeneiscleroticus]
MGDSDLIVDYDELNTMKSHFGKLSKEFNNCGANQGAMSDAYGHTRIISAMEEFSDNWDDHRKELMEQMKGTEDHVKKVIRGFEKIDSE